MSRPVRCQSGCLGVVLVLAVSSLALAQETPAFAQPQPPVPVPTSPDRPQPPVDSPLPAPVNPGVLNPHPSIFTEALYKGLYEPLAKHPPHKRAKHKQPRGPDSPPPALAPRSNHSSS